MTQSLTQEQLDELKALERNLLKGEWRHISWNAVFGDEDHQIVSATKTGLISSDVQAGHDVKFICEVRNLLPALIAMAEKAIRYETEADLDYYEEMERANRSDD